jgi:hypothetical protein
LVAWLGVVVTAVSLAITLPDPTPITLLAGIHSTPNPIGVPGDVFTANNIPFLWPLGLVLLVIAAVGLVMRYRRAAGEERQQIKWFAFAIAASMAAIVVGIPFSTSTGQSPANNVPLVLGLGVAVPAACGVAILKYRLYGIDVVINRTLVYGTLAVLITGVYVGIAVGIGTLVGSGGKPNLALSILATAIVAVGFQPVRERIQRVANRLVYGNRATPYEVLSRFSEQGAETYSSDDVLPRMARVLRDGTGSESATVWLRSGDELRAAVTDPPALNGDAPAHVNAAASTRRCSPTRDSSPPSNRRRARRRSPWKSRARPFVVTRKRSKRRHISASSKACRTCRSLRRRREWWSACARMTATCTSRCMTTAEASTRQRCSSDPV